MSTTGTFREGWLYKLSWINIHRSWRRRYFVLKGNELHYYKQPEDSKPKGIIELRHFRNVNPLPVKQSSWAFRIESGCRHHWNQHLYAESCAESQLWMESIQERLDKQLPGYHRCSASFHPSVMDDKDINSTSAKPVVATTITDSNDNSVLDKWLERLDLQEETPMTSAPMLTSTTDEEGELASSPSYLLRHHRPLSLVSLGYQSTDSLDTMASTGPLSSVFSDMSSSTLATPTAAAGGGSGGGGGVDGGVSNIMLADAFSQTGMVRRRTTTSDRHYSISSASAISNSSPSPPLSPYSLGTSTRRCRGTEWSSTIDLFHYMQGDEAVPRHTRYSMEYIPPRRLPPPNSPLPPTPQQRSTSTISVAAPPSSTINKHLRYDFPSQRFSTYSSARY